MIRHPLLPVVDRPRQRELDRPGLDQGQRTRRSAGKPERSASQSRSTQGSGVTSHPTDGGNDSAARARRGHASEPSAIEAGETRTGGPEVAGSDATGAAGAGGDVDGSDGDGGNGDDSEIAGGNGDGGDGDGVPGDVGSGDDEPSRLHPISIPYRIAQSGLRVVPILIVVGFVGAPMVGSIAPVVGVVVGLLAIGGLIAWHVVYWQRFSYQLTSDTFDIRSGVISRRHREIPYRRVQNVDISRDLLQRLVGIAQVNVETAGGSETEAVLRYVGYAEAKRLQDRLQLRKQAAQADRGVNVTEPGEEGSRPDASEEELLYAITPHDLLVLGVASVDLRVLSAIGLLLSVASPPFLVRLLTEVPINPYVLVGLLLAAIVLVSAIVSGARAIVNAFDFRLVRRGDELRYERGLLQRYDGSIPIDKVQTLALRENVLKRALGYSSLAIETAGYAPGRGDANIGSEAAVPIAKRERTWSIARELEPFGEVSLTKPPKRARIRYTVRYLLLLGAAIGIVLVVGTYIDDRAYLALPALGGLALLSPLAAHLKWRSRGYHVGRDYVVTRAGFWQRVTRIVPAYRVQTVFETATVFQRRWRLASVTVDTAGSGSLIGGDATAYDLDSEEAHETREAVAERLRATLRSAGEGLSVEPGGDRIVDD